MNRVRHTSRKFADHRLQYTALKRIKARRRITGETFDRARAIVVAGMRKEGLVK